MPLANILGAASPGPRTNNPFNPVGPASAINSTQQQQHDKTNPTITHPSLVPLGSPSVRIPSSLTATPGETQTLYHPPHHYLPAHTHTHTTNSSGREMQPHANQPAFSLFVRHTPTSRSRRVSPVISLQHRCPVPTPCLCLPTCAPVGISCRPVKPPSPH